MRQAPGTRYPALDRDVTADVVIVGAGLTGLWTAHYLLELDSELDIVILEAHSVGYGASGRNGGWISNIMPGHTTRLTKRYGSEAVRAQRDAFRFSVDETISAAETLGIDAGISKGGSLSVALNPAQAARQAQQVERSSLQFPEDKLELLSPEAVRERIAVRDAHGGVFNPNVARVQPGKLVRGLAESVVQRGARIFEHTKVDDIVPGAALFAGGRASARFVVRATEGFTTQFPGGDKEFLSMNSSMVLTTPQSQEFWDEVGWQGMELLNDSAHDYVYGQRTTDGRIAIGGRGVPYRFANRFDLDAPTPESTMDTLRRVLVRMFPAIDVSRFEDSWSGKLAVARDWSARVSIDRGTGLCAAGGYVGHGVAAANLAGRTLAELITGSSPALTTLPWVQHRSRRWEPEPLRWLGARGIYSAYRIADRRENASSSAVTSRFARLATAVAGRP